MDCIVGGKTKRDGLYSGREHIEGWNVQWVRGETRGGGTVRWRDRLGRMEQTEEWTVEYSGGETRTDGPYNTVGNLVSREQKIQVKCIW